MLLLQKKQEHNAKVALARPIPGTIYSGIIKQWIRWLFNKCYSLLKKLYQYCCHYFTTKICGKKKTTTATATATTTNSSSTNSTIGSGSNGSSSSSSSRRNCNNNWNCHWQRNCNNITDKLMNAITISYCGSEKTKEPAVFLLICLLFGILFGIIYAIYKSIVLYGISFL